MDVNAATPVTTARSVHARPLPDGDGFDRALTNVAEPETTVARDRAGGEDAASALGRPPITAFGGKGSLVPGFEPNREEDETALAGADGTISEQQDGETIDPDAAEAVVSLATEPDSATGPEDADGGDPRRVRADAASPAQVPGRASSLGEADDGLSADALLGETAARTRAGPTHAARADRQDGGHAAADRKALARRTEGSPLGDPVTTTASNGSETLGNLGAEGPTGPRRSARLFEIAPLPAQPADEMPKALGASLARHALDLRMGVATAPYAPPPAEGTVSPPATEPVPASRVAPVVAHITGAAGPSRLTVRLHPASLGAVEVEIVRRGGMVVVEMRADTPDAVRALEAERSAIEAQLRGRIETDGLGITVGIGLRGEQGDAHRRQPDENDGEAAMVTDRERGADAVSNRANPTIRLI